MSQRSNQDEKQKIDEEGNHSCQCKCNTNFSLLNKRCKKNQYVGSVSINPNFRIQFDLTVYGQVSGWGSILHIGYENAERIPGIWLQPGTRKLHVRLSEITDSNSGQDPDDELELNKTYRIKFECIETEVSLYIDGKRKTWRDGVIHKTAYLAPIFIGDPWYDAANALVSNLEIKEK